jgi:hypothetical protein
MKLVTLSDYNETPFALDIDADPIKSIVRPDVKDNPDFEGPEFPDDEERESVAYFRSIIVTMSGTQYKVGHTVTEVVRMIREQCKS